MSGDDYRVLNCSHCKELTLHQRLVRSCVTVWLCCPCAVARVYKEMAEETAYAQDSRAYPDTHPCGGK